MLWKKLLKFFITATVYTFAFSILMATVAQNREASTANAERVWIRSSEFVRTRYVFYSPLPAIYHDVICEVARISTDSEVDGNAEQLKRYGEPRISKAFAINFLNTVNIIVPYGINVFWFFIQVIIVVVLLHISKQLFETAKRNKCRRCKFCVRCGYPSNEECRCCVECGFEINCSV